MHYQNVRAAKFIDRPNRFIAHVELDGSVETVHVKNTGRCRELLVPGCTVYLEKGANPARKTAYDLIAVDKGGILINMDHISHVDSQTFRLINGEELPISLRNRKQLREVYRQYVFSGMEGIV